MKSKRRSLIRRIMSRSYGSGFGHSYSIDSAKMEKVIFTTKSGCNPITYTPKKGGWNLFKHFIGKVIK